MTANLTHDPRGLYRASLERMDAAWMAMERDDLVLAIYLAGLAVECVLQAVALRYTPTHDAKHYLARWLSRCPNRVQQAIKQSEVRAHWDLVAAEWQNRMRYYSQDALLEHLRQKHVFRRLKGEDRARMKTFCRMFVESANRVHQKGVSQWLSHSM